LGLAGQEIGILKRSFYPSDCGLEDLEAIKNNFRPKKLIENLATFKLLPLKISGKVTLRGRTNRS